MYRSTSSTKSSLFHHNYIQKVSCEENTHLTVGYPHPHLYSRINSRFQMVQIKMLNKLDFSQEFCSSE